jgi:hypothetical protein
MPKKDPSQESLRELRAMEAEDPSPEGIARLRTLIAHRSNHVVGRAAKLAMLWNADALSPDLAAAFPRFLEDPVKTDPGCAAKQPIIEALDALEHTDPTVYLIGVRYAQREPSFGPPIDTAANLRGACGHALLNLRHADAWLEMAALLNDPEARTRRMAMESLGGSESGNAELLLRMAVLSGDEEPDVTALGLQALMRVEPERSLSFVRGYLSNYEPILAEGAALAIGEARLPESFSILRQTFDRPTRGMSQNDLLLPMALTRDEAALDFLLGIVRSDRAPLARAALKALSIYSSQPERVAAIRDAVDARGEREMALLFNDLYDIAGSAG